MGKEGSPRNEIELDKRKTYDRMAISGMFALGGSIATCHWPVTAAPTIIYYAEFVRNFRKYKKLEKQTSISK